ncbi:MAG: preprotein translocase subunit SecY [Chitinophagales bacterium]|nr:preprotein translocase subunit SecY [Chitinophagales bacterium]
MKRFIDTIKHIFAIEELRKKILYTLGLLFMYRVGTFILLPGVNPAAVATNAESGGKGILGMFDMFAGGAFNRASIFALGIMPYISASIFMQLLSLAVPFFQRLQREGDSGRRKINQYTRVLTVLVTIFQGSAYVRYLTSTLGESGITLGSPFLFWLSTTIILTAGTIFVMWLGEKITDRGLGNGSSLIIMSGIISRLPGSLWAEFNSKLTGSGGGLLMFLIEMLFLVGVVIFTILLVQGTRKIPVQYAKRIVGNKQYGGVRQYIPLKVNISGVMPIIFAQAFLFIPATIIQFFPDQANAGGFIASLADYSSLPHAIFTFVLVVAFTYFYTALIVNPVQMADDLKRNNGFIPGVKPGKKTSEYIDTIMSRITLPGSVLLALIAIMPAFAGLIGINSQFAYFFGGTSLLILVSVVLDTLQQIETHLLNRHYDGLTKTGTKIKGRSSVGNF